MPTITEMRVERKGLIEKMTGMLDAADNESRELNSTEATEWDRLHGRAEQLRAEIEAGEAAAEQQRLAARDRHEQATMSRRDWISRERERLDAHVPRTRPKTPFGGQTMDGSNFPAGPAAPRQRTIGTLYGHDAKTGSDIYTYGKGESLVDALGGEYSPGIFGRCVRGMVTGDWSGVPEQTAALMKDSDTAGGYMVPSTVGAQVIDLARNASVCFQLGARTLPMPNPELRIATVDSDPTCYWRAETQSITQSEPTFGALVLQAKTLGVLVPLSVEIIEDAAGISALVERTIARAVALEIDRAILRGDGGGAEPTGLRYLDGVNERDKSAAIWGFGDLIDAVYDIWSNNGEPNGLVWHSRSAKERANIKDGEGLYIGQDNEPMGVKELVKLKTNSIPIDLGVGSNETEIYIGDFTQVLVGLRTSLRMEILRSGTVGSTNATSDMVVWLRAYTRVDVHFERANHFTRIIGVKST